MCCGTAVIPNTVLATKLLVLVLFFQQRCIQGTNCDLNDAMNPSPDALEQCRFTLFIHPTLRRTGTGMETSLCQ